MDFIHVTKGITCAGCHLVLPWPEFPQKCSWWMTLHWKQLHIASQKAFAVETTGCSSQQANSRFMKLTGPHPQLSLCLIWLGRSIWHLNHEFPVWGWISMAEAFKNSPGVQQESWMLWGLFVPTTLWTVLAAKECFIAPCLIPVPEDILSSSSHTVHHVSPFTNTCVTEEFLCKLQSSRKRVQKSFAHEKRDREKRETGMCWGWLSAACGVNSALQQGHFTASRAILQSSRIPGKWVRNNFEAPSLPFLIHRHRSSDANFKLAVEPFGNVYISHNSRSNSPYAYLRLCCTINIWGRRTTYYRIIKAGDLNFVIYSEECEFTYQTPIIPINQYIPINSQ